MSRISDIVAATDDEQKEVVDITAWGISIEVRGLTLPQRSEYLRTLFEARDAEDQETLDSLDAQLCIEASYDPSDGTKVFDDSHLPMLMGKAAAVVTVLSFKIQKLSGLDMMAEERLGKDFSASALMVVPGQAVTPSASVTSDLPTNSE